MIGKEPVQPNEAWSLIRKNAKGEVTGKSTGINFDQLANKLKTMADNMDHLKIAEQIINEACAKNNGLPF